MTAPTSDGGPATVRALLILREWRRANNYQEIRPKAFALMMWPDSLGWQRIHKCGPKGVSHGAMMPKVGGGFLGKLRARGLISGRGGLTTLGDQLLAQRTRVDDGQPEARK